MNLCINIIPFKNISKTIINLTLSLQLQFPMLAAHLHWSAKVPEYFPHHFGSQIRAFVEFGQQNFDEHFGTFHCPFPAAVALQFEPEVAAVVDCWLVVHRVPLKMINLN
jgi:hypothetical protein